MCQLPALRFGARGVRRPQARRHGRSQGSPADKGGYVEDDVPPRNYSLHPLPGGGVQPLVSFGLTGRRQVRPDERCHGWPLHASSPES